MRFDSLSMFADAQALTGTTADGKSIVDLGKAGAANPPNMYVTILVTTAINQDTEFVVNGSDDKSAWTPIVSSGKRLKANLVEGTIINLPIQGKLPRYLKLTATAGEAISAGVITAGIQLAPQTQMDEAVFASAR